MDVHALETAVTPLQSRFREMMLEATAALVADSIDGPYGRPALMLSGGVDSSTVLAALLALNRPPRCFTFTLGTYTSEDMRAARAMTSTLCLELVEVSIPRNPATLEADVRRLVPMTGTKKTWVQCGQPFLYVSPEVKRRGHDAVLTALMADELWGTSKNVAMHWRERGEEWARDRRREAHAEVLGEEVAERRVAREFGLRVLDPFADQDVAEFVVERDYAELHVPRLKQLAVGAFPEFWARGAWYRSPLNYQIGSGIRAWHDTLLSGPLNTRGARSVVAVYNDVAAGRV